MKKFLLLVIGLAMTSAIGARSLGADRLVSLQLVDPHGLSETMTTKDRLASYHKVNWFSPQPYRKVVRVYAADRQGVVRSFAMTYHPNGHPKQYLQMIDGRPNGIYYEWHQNGFPKLAARVVGGVADVDKGAVETYLFHGVTEAWDEEGQLLARVPYKGGELHGTLTYFHPNGEVRETVTYIQGLRDGELERYRIDGSLLEWAEYQLGERNGFARGFQPDGSVAFDECYCEGLLESGEYFDCWGASLCTVDQGSGVRAIDCGQDGFELISYNQGRPEGRIDVYDVNGKLRRRFHVKDGCKDGQEIVYYPPQRFATAETSVPCPKLQLSWVADQIQGVARTWYSNGQPESQREMASNRRNGLSTAWYEDGSVMLLEEYRDDLLIKGEYYPPGSSLATSHVSGGNGIATLYDPRGNVVSQISYLDGLPVS